MTESLYDRFAHYYWAKCGLDVDEMLREYLQKFFALVGPSGVILSAACGAARFEDC
jgi:hypothetical protein